MLITHNNTERDFYIRKERVVNHTIYNKKFKFDLIFIFVCFQELKTIV